MGIEFEPGELFVYTNGNRWELGMVKRPNNSGDGYFCWYSRGDTAANTPTTHMHKLSNAGFTHIEHLLDAATVGAETCRLLIEKRPHHGPWIYHYGCGYDFWQPAGCPMPVLKHCPNCGKRIAKED